MADFALSCCKLFEQHPLYRYRSPAHTREGEYDLNVLLIGYGPRMDTILKEVLTQGQLLDTRLDVTIANTNAEGTMESLLKRAPAIKDFARLIVNMCTVSAPADNALLCTIRFDTIQLAPEAMEDVLIERSECTYVIISTGNDSRNYAIASACAAYTADQETIVTYVQKKESEEIEVFSPLTKVKAFGTEQLTDYQKQIEEIAFNLHYAYAKAQNERADYDQILREFQDPYNYLSNMEAALHIRNKLACCGIYDENPSVAAKKFADLLARRPEILERLSSLEHARWVMEKVLQGYRPIESHDQIYRNGATTHSKIEKWHCCLVPCDKTGTSHIEDADWSKSNPDIIRRLDPLDKVSLWVHKKCGERYLASIPLVDEMLRMLREALASNACFSAETIQAERNIELAINQMRQQKTSAIPLFECECTNLDRLIEKEGAMLAPLMGQTLKSLQAEIAPLREYITKKDFKAQDRILVQQIPFALTYRPCSAVVKVLSEKNYDNIIAPWLLDASAVCFIALASDQTELAKIREMASACQSFLGKTAQSVSFLILSSDSVITQIQGDPVFSIGWDCSLIPVQDFSLPAIQEEILEILKKQKPRYLDVTGGDPLLVKAATDAACLENIGVIYSHTGKLRNLTGAEEIEYVGPGKSFSVQELFEISGAVTEESEATKPYDLSLWYKDLWNVAQSSDLWDPFCKHIASAYKDTKESFIIIPPTTPDKPQLKKIMASSAAAAALMPALRQMEEMDFLENVSTNVAMGDQKEISFTVNGKKVSSFGLCGFIQTCCGQFRPGQVFKIEKNDDGQDCLTKSSLMVRNVHFPDLVNAEFTRLLRELKKYQFIINLRRPPETDGADIFDFEIASREVLACLQTSGTVLEYYIYYSARLDGHFDDVDMGYKFQHSTHADSAENEIDVICTKGTESLFVSAKMGQQKALLSNNKLNYVLYEIALLSRQFGLNAKPVLVAPALPMFSFNPISGKKEFSNEYLKARSRGVYLLGKESVERDKVGEMLDGIIDGRADWYTF